MAIPDYQALMLPLLEFASDGKEHSVREAVEAIAQRLGITEGERRTLLPSGAQPVFDNRVSWARTYLAEAGLLERTQRGYFRITERGATVLRERPSRLDVAYLERFPEFREFRMRRREPGRLRQPVARPSAGEEATPEEVLADAYSRLRSALAEELLDRVKSAPPHFFERLVVDVLVAMGYGGSQEEAGRAVGGSGDEGIDGVIFEDRLGLDVLYVQAKRWDHPVGRPEVQQFAGALQGRRARKGVLITTSTFTSDARDYASSIDSRIVLVDGRQLVELMIEHGVGVSPVRSYEVKRVDTDYFAGE